VYIDVKDCGKAKADYSVSMINFVIEKLMPRMAGRLGITVQYVSNLRKNEGIYGDCIWEDDDYRPREFMIRLDRGLNLKTAMTTLAHEMVHVKQYARDEMRQLTTKRACRYNGELYKDGLDYWDQPWEIEAHGREVGLFIRWVEKEGLAHKPWAQEKC